MGCGSEPSPGTIRRGGCDSLQGRFCLIKIAIWPAAAPINRGVLYNCAVSAPILATKLYIPPPRPNAVPRPQLISRLDAGLQRKLTLLSAPVGYGKSTLLSEWVAGSQRPALVGEASL